MRISSIFHCLRGNKEGGFTLAELMVTVSITVVIMSIVFLNQARYTDTALLQNTATDIGLSLRQAGTYGIAVREFKPGSGEFSAGYGMAFDLLPSGSNGSYIFFADRSPRDYNYSSSWSCPTDPASECLEKVTLPPGMTVSQICRFANDGTETCDVGRLVVTFTRPDTNARLSVWGTDGHFISDSTDLVVVGARVKLHSLSGLERSVIIYTTGQVSVQ